ncbi:MAG: MFS transporter [Psittacicella sp.]
MADALAGIIYGALSDSYGRKKILLFGVFTFGLTSFLLAQVTSIGEFLALRILQGIGISALGSAAYPVMRDIFSGKDFARASSISSTVFLFAPAFAPTIGGFLVKYYGWRSIFYFMFYFAIFGFLLLLLIPETLNKNHRKPFHPISILSDFKRVILNKKVMGYICINFCCMGAFFCFLTNSPLIFMSVYKMSPIDFGYLMGFFAIFIAINNLISFSVVKKFEVITLFRFGILLRLFISFIILAITLIDSNIYLFTIAILAFVASGAYIMPFAESLIMDNFTTGTGVISAVIFVIGSVIIFFAIFLLSFIKITSPIPLAVFMCGLMVLGVLIYTLLNKFK